MSSRLVEALAEGATRGAVSAIAEEVDQRKQEIYLWNTSLDGSIEEMFDLDLDDRFAEQLEKEEELRSPSIVSVEVDW